MSTKARKQVYLEPRQENLLKLIAQQTGVSEAEIIRQAIDRHWKHPNFAKTTLTWDETATLLHAMTFLWSLPTDSYVIA